MPEANITLRDLGDDMYLQVLGCGSARPTRMHHPSAQVLKVRNKLFMIDCGEGTQMRVMKYGVPLNNLYCFFISHLHGDHVLGLPGLISTMRLTGLNHPIDIYGPRGIKSFVERVVFFFCGDDQENIRIHELNINGSDKEVIYEDHSVKVTAFSLSHRIPTLGYRFDEAPKRLHLDREMADYHEVPIAYFGRVKQGEDYIKPDGSVVPNHLLTKTPRTPFSYAYCSDTLFSESNIEAVQGVDLLYHETTFSISEEARAIETMHSTTQQAATVAKRGGVGHLLIGHYSARYSNHEAVEELLAECKEIFPHSLAASEGSIYDLGDLRTKLL